MARPVSHLRSEHAVTLLAIAPPCFCVRNRFFFLVYGSGHYLQLFSSFLLLPTMFCCPLVASTPSTPVQWFLLFSLSVSLGHGDLQSREATPSHAPVNALVSPAWGFSGQPLGLDVLLLCCESSTINPLGSGVN